MCGRLACTKSPEEIVDACNFHSNDNNLSKPGWKNMGSSTYKQSYNNGPKSCSPILLKNRFKVNDENLERIIMPMQWGLIPSWHKGNPKDFSFNMINCRKDTITEKKSFLKALEKGQRCVVLADGFYEWLNITDNGKEKQPYYLHLKDDVKPHVTVNDAESSTRMITMAGIFDKIPDEEEELYTFTIITVDASSSLNWLHHRMPAVLETEEAIGKWLDVDNVPYKKALDCLVPTDSLTWYPVSKTVSNVRNNSSECIKKVDLVKEAARKSASGNLMSAWLKKGEKRGRKTVVSELSPKRHKT